MAAKIFLMLNGMGVVFLIYVLTQFVREDQRSRAAADRSKSNRSYREGTDVVVAVLPPAHEVARMRSRAVIQFRSPTAVRTESKLATKSADIDERAQSKGLGAR